MYTYNIICVHSLDTYTQLRITQSVLHVIVRSWFCMVYEAAKPRVDYANQLEDLTILVPLIADPLTS